MQILILSGIAYLSSAACSTVISKPRPLIPSDGRTCPLRVSFRTPVDHECCNMFVANRNEENYQSATNRRCQTACRDEPTSFLELHPECMFQNHVQDLLGKVRIEFDPNAYLCYSNWIYGYSEPADMAGYRAYDGIMNARDCQTLCQEDEKCVHFMWLAPSVAERRTPDGNRCYLKNQAQIEAALDEDFTDSSEVKDTNFCPELQASLCYTHAICTPNLFEKARRTCVYQSAGHVSGPKFCKINKSTPEYSTEQFCYPPRNFSHYSLR